MFDTARPRLRLLTVAAMAGSVVLLPALASAQAGAPADATSERGSKASRTAVTAWNGYAGEAALAACIDPLHESRMYAMTHIAIYDALNAIDRRSKPYAFSARAPHGTSVNAAVAAAAHDVLVPLDPLLSWLRERSRERRGGLRHRARCDPRRAGQGPGNRPRPGSSGGDPGRAHRRRLRYSVGRLRLPAGHRTRRVPLHPWDAVRLCTRLGRGDAVRTERQRPVPSRAAVLS